MKNCILFSLLCLLLACQAKQSDSKNDTPTATTELPSDFLEFYDRFHANSDFQLSRIVFPLEGLPANADSLDFVSGTFKWQKEDWQIHKKLAEDNPEFTRELYPLGKYTVVEKITHVKQGFAMQRRFYKQSDGWYLIYYAGMNRTD